VRPDHRSHRRAHGLETRPVQKVAPHISPNAIFASNTSGLSITKLAEGFDADLKARYCGVHFFNPPRYMHLVEIIPTPDTKPEISDQLEGFLTSTLGKGVVRARTPRTSSPTALACSASWPSCTKLKNSACRWTWSTT
jgi:hypothetical protein